MKKRTEVFLVVFLLLLAGFWRFFFWEPGVYGADVFYHYTIVEQAIKEGELSNDNNLAMCYESAKEGHPHGYYAFPYFFGKIMGLDNTFIFLPILIGVIALFLAYILIRYLFNRKIAMLSLFFLSISVAHVSKSFPFSWRGDNLIYPFLLVSLICMSKFMFENKIRHAILAGMFSGVTIWFWNGYPAVILIYLACLFICLFYKYFKKENLENNLKLSVLSLMVQAIVLYLLYSNIELSGKGMVFGGYYYLFIFLASLTTLSVLYFAYKKESHAPLLLLAVFGLVSVFIAMPYFKLIIAGFGSVQSSYSGMVTELRNPQPYQWFFAFYILVFAGILGVFYYTKNFDAKKALFLGLLLPSLYLVTSAIRFMYFASLPIIVLGCVFFDNKKIIGKRFDLFVFVTVTAMAIMFVYGVNATPVYYSDNLRFNNIEPYTFLKESTDEDACVLDLPYQGATVEKFAKRYAYFHTLGYSEERGRVSAEFLMGNESYDFGIEKFYVMINYASLYYLNIMNSYVGYPDIGFFRMATTDEELNESQIREELNFMKVVAINGNVYVNESGNGCVYFYKGDYFYLTDGVCNTNIYRMLTNQTVDGYKNIYYKDGYVIYKYEHGK